MIITLNLSLITPPSVELVNINDLKSFLRIDSDDDDAYLEDLAKAARVYCETYQKRAYITQTWEMYLPDFVSDVIDIPKGSLQTIDFIKYKNSDGMETTLASSDYIYSNKGIVGKLTHKYGSTWPSFTPYPLDAVTIRFTCGYGNMPYNVPDTIKHAIKLLVAHWYEIRQIVNVGMSVSAEIQLTLHALLSGERLIYL